ncbi:MAG: DUF2244 domain-containing protein [Elsteraceae bacterium]
MIQTAPSDNPQLLLDAVLLPNRSLSHVGMALVLGGVAVVSFGAGVAFLLAGAWPVLGFLGVDAGLLALAFHIHQKRQRAYERVQLTQETLVYEQVTWHGLRRCWTFPSYWVRLKVIHDHRPSPTVTLSSHGLTAMVGRNLSEEDRLDLADRLRAALAQVRAP